MLCKERVEGLYHDLLTCSVQYKLGTVGNEVMGAFHIELYRYGSVVPCVPLDQLPQDKGGKHAQSTQAAALGLSEDRGPIQRGRPSTHGAT